MYINIYIYIYRLQLTKQTEEYLFIPERPRGVSSAAWRQFVDLERRKKHQDKKENFSLSDSQDMISDCFISTGIMYISKSIV